MKRASAAALLGPDPPSPTSTTFATHAPPHHPATHRYRPRRAQIIRQLTFIIDKANGLLNDARDFHFVVGGHADVPKAKAMKAGIVKLTQKRADFVVQTMVRWDLVNCRQEMLHARGYGGCCPLPLSVQPIAGMALPNGDRPNMRVEVSTIDKNEAHAFLKEPLVWRQSR